MSSEESDENGGQTNLWTLCKGCETATVGKEQITQY